MSYMAFALDVISESSRCLKAFPRGAGWTGELTICICSTYLDDSGMGIVRQVLPLISCIARVDLAGVAVSA
jgi:hypothetical protein